MKTLLVLGRESGLGAAVHAVLEPERYRLVAQEEIDTAEPFLRAGTFDACLFDAEHFEIRPIRLIEKLRRQMPDTPLLVFVGSRQWEWEEEAYLLGVVNVLTKPVRGRLLNSLLDRLWEPRLPAGSSPISNRVDPAPATPPAPAPSPLRTLEVLRDFSAILSHGLSPDALLNDFLLLLRRILGVNRAAIFLREPQGNLAGPLYRPEARRLRAARAIGLSPGLVEHFELSLEAGIGGHVYRHGRVVRHSAEVARLHPDINKEFELLGTTVAVPILDRESLVGVAVLDERLTGESISSEELTLIFHLLEELGLAIRNSWLHDQLAASHEMMSGVLGQLNSGCVVVARDLTLLHANPASRRFFPAKGGARQPLEFSDLPQVIGSKVFEVIKEAAPSPAFKYEPPEQPGVVYLASITPFKRGDSERADAVLLMVDDFTQLARSQQLEIEASNLRLVRTMAEGLAHEIGNSLVPLSTHQQLLVQKYDDVEFRASLTSAMADGVKRISRLANQLLYLSRDSVTRPEPVRINRLIEEAFREAQSHFPEKASQLIFDNTTAFTFTGDRSGLKHALAEVMLNALQAIPANPKVRVRLYADADPQGSQWLRIELEDSGAGFTAESAKKAVDPFFTTRNVGLGLGLTVTKKIVEAHHGKLEIEADSRTSTVVIVLPLEAQAAEAPKPAETFAILKEEMAAESVKPARKSASRVKFATE